MGLRIDEVEFAKFIKQTKTQDENLAQIVQQVDRAVKGRGSNFNSAAADDFEQHWDQNMATLKQLRSELDQVVAKLKDHQDTAHRANQKF